MNKALSIIITLSFLLPCAPMAADGLDGSDIIFYFPGPTDSSHVGRSCVAGVGDINGDGYDDIAFTSYYLPQTFVCFGGNPPDSIPDQILKGYFSVFGDVDLDGDGITDVVTSKGYVRDSDPSGVIYFYKGFGDSLGAEPFDSIYTDTSNRGLGEQVVCGYVNDNGTADLLTYSPHTPFGPTLVYWADPATTDHEYEWSFQILNASHTIHAIGLLDFNGDGVPDIFAGLRANLDSLSYVYIFTGPDFDSLPNIVIGHPDDAESGTEEDFGERVFNVGDVDGDGWEDLAVKRFRDFLIYRGGPGWDTLWDYKLAEGYRGPLSAAGDINGDGYNDLMAGITRKSSWGGIDVYLGGPEWDIYDDGYLDKWELPLGDELDEIGWRVSSAGDFNGDGYDDLLFSTLNLTGNDRGGVIVAKGGDDVVTDVEEIEGLLLPDDFVLSQNYPNPFNPSTTIEFALPETGHTTLTVYNILGETVVTLIDHSLAAGAYRIVWDGRDDDDRLVATGIYLYKLSLGDGLEQSRKMILLK